MDTRQQQQRQPVSPLQAGFPSSVHLQHQMLQSQQQSPQQGSDAAPQDVLAEARKNLQVLIDSGISRDLLHQQLALLSPSALPTQQLLQQQQQHMTQQPAPQSHLENHQLNHLQNHQHQHQQQHQSNIPLAPTYQPPPPPAPQCPPPPVPSLSSNNRATASQPAPVSSGPSASVAVSAPMDVKPEMIPEDGSAVATWAPSGAYMNAGTIEDALFMQQPGAPFSHRPRISVSSTSSGSSGHASIWSTNSAQSAMSWQSGATAPPMPMHSPTGAPLMKAAQIPQLTQSATIKNTNIYWCTSCETSFKRKYDWKRHEDEFHERWRKYPCPEPGCNRSFWGSNSFNQHHKQCHGCTTCPHAEKVVRFLRKRKYWACGFCSALHPARERHVEHVARHFESGLTKADWMHSRVIYGLLHQPLIHDAWEAVVSGKHPGRRPQFSWHPGKTGRAQGFLEKENPGQLQDLLEFFSGEEGETQAQWVVGVAYDLADVVTNNINATDAPLPPAPTQEQRIGDDNTMGPPPPPQDSRMSFVPLPSQASHHQPGSMTSQESQGNHAFASQYRGPMFLPSQAFSTAQTSSPESSSHSPLTASQSPLTATTSPGDKRDMPLPRAPQEGAESMMDFEYSPAAPVVFDDWESFAGPLTDESRHHGQWGMAPQFFTSDPRVPS